MKSKISDYFKITITLLGFSHRAFSCVRKRKERVVTRVIITLINYVCRFCNTLYVENTDLPPITLHVFDAAQYFGSTYRENAILHHRRAAEAQQPEEL